MRKFIGLLPAMLHSRMGAALIHRTWGTLRAKAKLKHLVLGIALLTSAAVSALVYFAVSGSYDRLAQTRAVHASKDLADLTFAGLRQVMISKARHRKVTRPASAARLTDPATAGSS